MSEILVYRAVTELFRLFYDFGPLVTNSYNYNLHNVLVDFSRVVRYLTQCLRYNTGWFTKLST